MDMFFTQAYHQIIHRLIVSKYYVHACMNLGCDDQGWPICPQLDIRYERGSYIRVMTPNQGLQHAQ